MPFVNGQTLDETDFIFSAIAGQAIAARDAIMIGNGTDTGARLVEILTSDNASQTVSATTWVAQRVRFDAVRNIASIGFRHTRTTGATYTVRIRSSLTGADLGSGSATYGSASGTIDYQLIALSATVNLTAGTDYYVIISITGGNTVYGQSTSAYANGEAHLSTNSGSSWSAHGSVADFGVFLIGGITEAGKIYKATVDLPNLYVGFAMESVSLGVSCRISPMFMMDGFSGLTVGVPYYLSATPGVIEISGSHKIAVAVSATKIVRTFMTI